MTVASRRPAQALLEFALVVPLFLILMFGLVDFARLLFSYVSFSNGAREMARVLAESTNWSSTNPAAAINAFNNYTLVAGSQAATDSVTVRYGTQTCARTLDTGGSCPTGSTDINRILTTVCSMPLPLTSGACTPALNAPPQRGFVEVQVTYTFQFNPLFQNKLDGLVDVSFMRPTAPVTTTSRAYVE